MDFKLIFLVVSLVILGFGMLLGLGRKLYSAFLRLITLLLSAAAAFILSKYALQIAKDPLTDLLKKVAPAELGAYMADPELVGVVETLALLIFAPLFFLLIYVVLKIVTFIVYKLLAAIFRLKKAKQPLGRLGGAVVGLLCGAVTLVVLLTPVLGYSRVALGVMEKLEIKDDYAAVAEPLETLSKTPIAAQCYDLLGKPLFESLTTAEWEGETVKLESEIEVIIHVVEDVKPLTQKPMQEYAEAEAQTLDKLADDLSCSVILRTLISSMLSDTSAAWLKGESALGMEKPQAGENMQGIVDAFLLVFSSSETDNIDDDLHTFARAIAVLIEHDLFVLVEEENGTDLLIEKLVSEGVAKELYAVLDANSRMRPVKGAIVDTGMRVMLRELGGTEDLRENHGEMLENMIDVLKESQNEDGTVNTEVLADSLQEVVTEYEIPVNEDVVQLVADGVAEIFTPEELSTLTTDEMVDKLIERLSSSDNPIELPDDLADKLPEDLPDELPDDWQNKLP
ncbi:MAG: hypothetical protein E7624_01940 [Ruminococcaceae bacterium]|nr:hypothetical protein [Oscillospiraceae bacterium]